MVKEGDVDAGCFLALNKANNQVLYNLRRQETAALFSM
jgi:hypothetical protein